ncbi:nitrite reductase small subunit NirD [Alkalilimnicola ehrlichii MLHE-1]|uniref:Assimilatory nitrite reductase (NAD(P)H) small subunit n=1 Tax=Alkalilimnicola ehrlichii (strain ATCC BAA-1101 / DSM 17681 / MLHE-1) TaxID=187272 RepID=Q0A7Z0_ALKEH|nr:nitrite reductase small subunit NirD [Alkalilimnicola ehrlichii]ABI57047.1 assimilatory nitrite reductase (NAD(P)H) small subunit [Alkalilimnicola ehrlichii MLHE-1]
MSNLATDYPAETTPAHHEDWLPIGHLDDIPRQGARVVARPEGDDIAIFRTADDALFAIGNRCPHQGGPLDQGLVHGHRVTCPLHGWRIQLEQGEAVAPDQGCVPRFPIRRDDRGNLYVRLTPVDAVKDAPET